ncbi:TadE/TadG family type IV pilus assembly protein [Marimonas lutisalis]|uniref:TadE/TadG family type IV pilus assembly protein n=1 Tax=Marimonas lutisalis TaxID=2545756 RepID=UPI0010F67975|nr:TadG family pilus assembly protein [Marimonas lutisalis]
MPKFFCSILCSFRRDERGTTTILSLFLVLIASILSGLAIDFNNGMARQTRMKAATESVAHAALYNRELNSQSYALAQAMDVAAKVLPTDIHGDALKTSDIDFGTWDPVTETFKIEESSRDAVRVVATRSGARGNAVSTFLLKIIGFDAFDLERYTVYETFIPTCFREGFVAEDVINVTSSNTYKSYFCLHSNTYVSVNSYNVFEAGSIVSMPDTDQLVLPSDGFETNEGLEQALREGGYQIRILDRIDEISEGVGDSTSPYYRSYISNSTPVSVDRQQKLDDTVFLPGRIYEINCTSSGQSAKIHAATKLSKVVIRTNCNLALGENVSLEDAVIINSNTAEKSVTGASGVRLGRDDSCAVGGDAQIVTYGGVEFPQYLSMYGGQIIAQGNVQFSSDANGIEGASIISGGTISGTTDMVMAFCNTAGMENNFNAQYFRIAQSEALSVSD